MKLKPAVALAAVLMILHCAAFAQFSGLIDAAKLDGANVWDFHGKKIGNIKHVLVDPQSGRARYAVVQVDKEWQLNDPEIAVPWGAFKITRETGKDVTFALDATKEKLESAPRFKLADADRFVTREAGTPIYKYWEIWWIEEPTPPAGKP